MDNQTFLDKHLEVMYNLTDKERKAIQAYMARRGNLAKLDRQAILNWLKTNRST